MPRAERVGGYVRPHRIVSNRVNNDRIEIAEIPAWFVLRPTGGVEVIPAILALQWESTPIRPVRFLDAIAHISRQHIVTAPSFGCESRPNGHGLEEVLELPTNDKVFPLGRTFPDDFVTECEIRKRKA